MKRYIRAARLNDYYDDNEIQKFMETCKGFGDFGFYRILDNMKAETTKSTSYSGVGPHGAVHNDNRYWKFVKTDDRLEAYEINDLEDETKIGEPFIVAGCQVKSKK